MARYKQTIDILVDGNTYDITLNRWTATFDISTNSSLFYGLTITITKDGSNVGSVAFDDQGQATFEAHETGVYMFSVLLPGESRPYTDTKTITVEEDQTIGVILNPWTATLTLHTDETDFIGDTVTVTMNNINMGSAIVGSDGDAIYLAHSSGTYVMTLQHSDKESYSITLNATTDGGSYSDTITRFIATMAISTTSSEFYGQSITVTFNDNNYDTISFDSSGTTINYQVYKTGTYKFILNYSASEIYEQTVNITTNGQTANIPINRWTATIQVSTKSEELVNTTLTVYKNGTNIDTLTLPSTVDTAINYVVHTTGTYKFATIYQGTEYSKEVSVIAETTYTASVSLGPELVSWSSGTDAQISDMLDAYYNGTITIADIKSVWSVGDSRTISLSAMSATGVGESHRAQSVEMVILDFEHDTLATSISGKTKAAITVQQKNCLRAANVADDGGSSNGEHGYMNSSNTNNGGWTNCARRTWCNNVYYAALPSGFKAMVKEATHQTTAGNQSATMNTDTDKCFLPSEYEVFGSVSYAKAQEGTQYEYYKTAANRYKLPKWISSSVSDIWWERSPRGSNSTGFCRVDSSGSADSTGASGARGLAPACCL